jgi:hypothetical protein
MIQDKLKLNDGKTELLIIGSKQQLQKLNPCHVRVGNADVLPVPIARDLGVWLDSNLSMSCHITKTCGAAFYWLHNIKLLTVIHAFVTSRLDYCNGLLYGLPNTELIKLQRVQNAAARLVTSTRKYDHITPIYYVNYTGYL